MKPQLTARVFRCVSAATVLMAVSVPVDAAPPEEQVFHKGDKILASPYGNTWQRCTLTTDREGTPHYYNYTAPFANGRNRATN